MQFFHGTKIDFVGKRTIFLFMSIALIVIGIAGTIGLGIDYGIDFEGGTEMAVEFQKPIKTHAVRTAVEDAGIKGSEIKSYGHSNQFLIRIKNEENAASNIGAAFSKDLKDNPYTVLKSDKIGPKIGGELRSQAFLAVLLSVIAILLYVAFRFEFVFGLGAIIALVHDVIITFTMIVLLQKTGIAELEVNQTILAAMLTVIGFSINDTVIIFDRIRENKDSHKGLSFTKLVNLSINETLSRTINTVMTVVIVLVVLVLFGGSVLQGFALTMLLGIIFGTYSSIYIASSFVIWYLEKVKKHKVDTHA